MTASARAARFQLTAPLMVAVGFLLALAAWSLPVNLKSISPALLREAGLGTPSVAQFGLQLVESEKIGPAALALEAAKAVQDPGVPALAKGLDALSSHAPEMVAWGGWDPFLDPLFNLRENRGRPASTPVLTFFITENARQTLRSYLSQSRSLGVQSLLRLRELSNTGRFVPAHEPGGQPLEAVILLTALLYQGEHLAPPLQRDLRGLAETALAQKELGELEPCFIDLLSLGKRLDWAQLGELLRRTESPKTVGEFAHLARVAPDQLPLIYTAALYAGSADRVASYLITYGKNGLADLRLALAHGQGAVNQLLLWQVPVNHGAGASLGAAAALVLLHPRVMIILKYLGYLLGAFLIFRGLDRWIVPPGATATLGVPRMKSGVLALLLATVFVIVSEPFLLRAAPLSEYRFRLVLPALVATSQPPAPTPSTTTPTMDASTLISIGVFAALQVAMYFTCLLKIREVARSDLAPLVKLRLMENEENLFDGGLYVGIAGTASALVLQVLGVIEPNLLAAYSSNLFGITCVAFVKIRHVRPYKRLLILEGQAAIARPAS
ncbi:MAG: hypothetical protein JSR48_10010 [Verrucomicrobia bacterium]|nr:hypothetical protein [Verrucomicrobiota bacterium]